MFSTKQKQKQKKTEKKKRKNINLQLPLSFYSSLLFVTEALLISEQIIEWRFGALLEISNKFSSKLNAFSYMIFQCWFNILESFINILYDFEKHSGKVIFLERPQFVPQSFFQNWKKYRDEGFNLAYSGKVIKKWGRLRFYLSCNYSFRLYFLVKMLLVKLKNLHISAYLNLSYETAKQKPNM